MQPWHPDNKLFIIGELAKMDVVDPGQAKELRAHYDKKMAKYTGEHPEPEEKNEEPKPKKEEPITETITTELEVEAKVEPVTKTVTTTVKKKRGRKPKSSPTL